MCTNNDNYASRIWNLLSAALTEEDTVADADAEGWRYYTTYPPPPNALCQFRQQKDPSYLPKVWVGYLRDFPMTFNVSNLKWRYTGIAKEERGL